MKFLIRADASLQIGSGHIMRCLTLAHTLREHGHTVRFISRAHRGHLAPLVGQNGFDTILLPETAPAAVSGSLAHAQWLGTSQAQDFADCAPHLAAFAPDWVVCDHYALSADWEQRAAAVNGARILAIDDLHDRPHHADLLLDQNLGRIPSDYTGLLPSSCRILAGTRYALLRPEFAQWRPVSLANRRNRQSSGRVFINLGGVDKDNITLSLLQALAALDTGSLKAVTVVMGAAAPHTAAIEAFAATAPFACTVLVNAGNMAQLMAQADWAIGAAGSSAWERCCLGLPTLLLVLADNQRDIAAQLHAAGAAQISSAATPSELSSHLAWFGQAEHLSAMSQRAAALCDGSGAARVVRHIEELSQAQPAATLRRAQAHDDRLLFAWRNHPDIRRFMRNPQELVWDEHAAWFARQLHHPDFIMWIYSVDDVAQGYVSFKKQPENIWEWGFYTAPTCPRGHGTRMGRMALAQAFAELGAASVRGQVLPHNTASIRLHEKLGFFRLPEAEGMVQFALPAQQFAY